MEFEKATELRDEIKELNKILLEMVSSAIRHSDHM